MTEVMHPFGAWSPALAAKFIEDWEGRRLAAYKCSAGVWTIGVGHTDGVAEGMTITQQQADAWLIEDIAKAQRELAKFINVKVSEGQFIALVSLAFNVGAANVVQKCPKLMRAVNCGDVDEAAHQMLDIVKAGGQVLPGLVKRRKAEAVLFLKETEP